MSLDTSRLENVIEREGKTIARCPACAERGQDHSGDHLAIFPDGKFWCIADDTPEHRSEIYRLVGIRGEPAERGPIPIPIRRPECVLREPRTLRTYFSDFLAHREQGEGDHIYKRSPENVSEVSVNPVANGTGGVSPAGS
jgi:hypothetical protein